MNLKTKKIPPYNVRRLKGWSKRLNLKTKKYPVTYVTGYKMLSFERVMRYDHEPI